MQLFVWHICSRASNCFLECSCFLRSFRHGKGQQCAGFHGGLPVGWSVRCCFKDIDSTNWASEIGGADSGCKSKDPQWRSSPLHRYGWLCPENPEGTGSVPLLGWQLHKLPALLPHPGLQPRFQGHLQEDVPKIQPQDGILEVLWCQLGVWRFGSSSKHDHCVPIGLCPDALGFGRGFWKGYIQWIGWLHHEDCQGTRWILCSVHRFRCFSLRHHWIPRPAVGHFRHHHGLESLEEGPWFPGSPDHFRSSPDRHYHRSRCHISIRHGAKTTADAVREASGRTHLQRHRGLFQEDCRWGGSATQKLLLAWQAASSCNCCHSSVSSELLMLLQTYLRFLVGSQDWWGVSTRDFWPMLYEVLAEHWCSSEAEICVLSRFWRRKSCPSRTDWNQLCLISRS